VDTRSLEREALSSRDFTFVRKREGSFDHPGNLSVELPCLKQADKDYENANDATKPIQKRRNEAEGKQDDKPDRDLAEDAARLLTGITRSAVIRCAPRVPTCNGRLRKSPPPGTICGLPYTARARHWPELRFILRFLL
jgi:hypothetical protein